MIKKLLTPLASLRLTVILLAMSMLLVYAGTWAQIDAGIWEVQKKYFHSWFTWINFATFLPRPQSPGDFHMPGGFPFLGGYTLGALLLTNLLAAHSVRFKFSAKRIGVILIHFGLVLLLLGEFFTSLFAVESQMTIMPGEGISWSQDIRHTELAVVDKSPSDYDQVVVIPEGMLKKDAVINDPALPFTVRIDAYYANSNLVKADSASVAGGPRATDGMGLRRAALERPRISGVGGNAVDAASAYVTLMRNGQTNRSEER